METKVKASKIESEIKKEDYIDEIDEQIQDIIETKKRMLKNRKIDLC